MEFKIFFATLKNRISDGYDVPEFFREIFAMITDVPEEEWGTPKAPTTKKVKDDTLRSYAKRTITKKFAQTIVYRLSRDNFIDSINSHSVDTRELIANDFISYDSTLTAENVAEKTADWFIEIIRSAAGLAPKTELEQQKQQQLSADLKIKYGQYLLNEVGRHCPFPGCDRSLTKSANGRTIDSYDICTIDKKKAPEISNLLALCPQCYATYFLDDSTATLKTVKAVKKLLEAHNKNVSLLEDLSLEKNIIGVINNIKNLKAKDLVDVSLEPKEIKQKLKSSDDIILYNQVNLLVSTYFVRIREIMMNMDKRGEIDYEEVQDQMRRIYKKLKKVNKSNTEIFNEIVAKLHRVSLQEDMYCQLVVSYFIQSCEVFDAITE